MHKQTKILFLPSNFFFSLNSLPTFLPTDQGPDHVHQEHGHHAVVDVQDHEATKEEVTVQIHEIAVELKSGILLILLRMKFSFEF